MLKKTLITFALLIAASQAEINELLPRLKSKDLAVQKQARIDLLAACSRATAPDAPKADREKLCREICAVLESNPPVVSVILPALENLARIGADESVPTLVTLMSHSDAHVRDEARRALALNPAPAAEKALFDALGTKQDATTTASLIIALGERGSKQSAERIGGFLASENDAVFLAAAKALGRIGSQTAAEALGSAWKSAEGSREIALSAALIDANRPEVFGKLHASGKGSDELRAAALLGYLLAEGASSANEAMASCDPALQVAVIEAALQSQDAELLNVLAKHLAGLAPHLQVRALTALEFSEERAFAKSVEPLLSGDAAVRDAAAKALGRIGTKGSVEPLLADGSQEANRALGRLSVEGVDGALEKAAGAGSRRSAAIAALANRGRRDLLPVFFEYAMESDADVVVASIDAIGQLGELDELDALVDVMIAKETERSSRDALEAVVSIMRQAPDASAAVEVLTARMADASPRSQANLLQALAQTESPEALASLAEACSASDERIRKTAIKLVAAWKSVDGIPVLLELAANDSASLSDHVTLMRGVSRLFASEKPQRLNKELAQKAIDTCRRDEERSAIQSTLDKASGSKKNKKKKKK